MREIARGTRLWASGVGDESLKDRGKKMSVMGFEFVLGAVKVVAGSVYALNVGLYALLKVALMGMTVLGGLMGVAPDRLARDMMLLEGVGHAVLLLILVRSSAAILCEMI